MENIEILECIQKISKQTVEQVKQINLELQVSIYILSFSLSLECI